MTSDAPTPAVPATLLETIPNAHPTLSMRIRLSNPFAQLCPFSSEPQPGSTLTISYTAGLLLLETKALRRYLASFAGENPYGVRDLEEAVQVIAQHSAAILHVPVHVHAHYLLSSGSMEVEVEGLPSGETLLAPQ